MGANLQSQNRSHNSQRRLQGLVRAIALGVGLAIAGVGGDRAWARDELPDCEPPQPGEFLLLVRRANSAMEDQLYKALPQNVSAEPCRYVGESVMRLEGFPSLSIAKAWADYVRDRTGLQAFAIESPSARAAAAFRPTALGNGYAVLVNYFDDPTVAQELREFLKRDVGLASYADQAFLLASNSGDGKAASELMQRLSDRGFSSMVVDSRQVTLLRQAIALPVDR
jgi:hypothetical protein